jgi:hypothetical protein
MWCPHKSGVNASISLEAFNLFLKNLWIFLPVKDGFIFLYLFCSYHLITGKEMTKWNKRKYQLLLCVHNGVKSFLKEHSCFRPSVFHEIFIWYWFQYNRRIEEICISWKRICMKTDCSFRKAFAPMCKYLWSLKGRLKKIRFLSNELIAKIHN